MHILLILLLFCKEIANRKYNILRKTILSEFYREFILKVKSTKILETLYILLSDLSIRCLVELQIEIVGQVKYCLSL